MNIIQRLVVAAGAIAVGWIGWYDPPTRSFYVNLVEGSVRGSELDWPMVLIRWGVVGALVAAGLVCLDGSVLKGRETPGAAVQPPPPPACTDPPW